MAGAWADMCNDYLERHDHAEWIDHRSYERTFQGYFKYECSVSFYFELSEVDFIERELIPQENTEDATWRVHLDIRIKGNGSNIKNTG